MQYLADPPAEELLSTALELLEDGIS